jgi:hypothetical protein
VGVGCVGSATPRGLSCIPGLLRMRGPGGRWHVPSAEPLSITPYSVAFGEPLGYLTAVDDR